VAIGATEVGEESCAGACGPIPEALPGSGERGVVDAEDGELADHDLVLHTVTVTVDVFADELDRLHA
jgi:hypothetical protein